MGVLENCALQSLAPLSVCTTLCVRVCKWLFQVFPHTTTSHDSALTVPCQCHTFQVQEPIRALSYWSMQPPKSPPPIRSSPQSIIPHPTFFNSRPYLKHPVRLTTLPALHLQAICPFHTHSHLTSRVIDTSPQGVMRPPMTQSLLAPLLQTSLNS